MYGLKDSPLFWNRCLHKVLVDNGYKNFEKEGCLYSDGVTWIIVYVDDLLYVSKESKRLDRVEEMLEKKFNAKKTDMI